MVLFNHNIKNSHYRLLYINIYLKRDGSGNFSAGTITANLTGNVTGNATNVTGTVAVANGGTGANTITGLVKGNGTGAMTAAVAGTDYLAPNGSAANLTNFPTLINHSIHQHTHHYQITEPDTP